MPLPYPTNPNLQAVPVYQPGRPIEEVARELGLPADDIIKLASNENPLGPSRLALAAMRKALAQVNLYPDGNAFYLKQKLAAKLGVTPAHLILGNGSNEIIEFVGHALLAPGAEVVVSQYCFAVYPIVTALFGGKLVVVPAKNTATTSTPCWPPSRRTRGWCSSPTRTTRPAPSPAAKTWPGSSPPCPRTSCSPWTRPTSNSWTSRSTCCRRFAAAGRPTCC